MNLFKRLAIVGDFAYILWILYNGVDEFKLKTTTVHVLAYIGIIVLLILNIILLRKEK